MAVGTERLPLSHLIQIDVLKGLAILAVLMQHTISVNNVASDAIIISGTTVAPNLQIFTAFLLSFLALTSRQAVPVFVILLGVNSALSFIRRRYTSLREGYSKEYCLRRIERLYVPFLVILLVSLLVGLLETYLSNTNPMHLSLFAIAGVIPIYAPGNYFILLVFQFTILFPLLFFLYTRNPRFFIGGCFLVGFLTQFPYVISGLLPAGTYIPEILRYLPGIALGMWIAQDLEMYVKRNRFILFFTPISIAVLVLTVLSRYNTPILPFKGLLTLLYPLVFFFPVFLVLIGIQYFPKSSQNRLIGIVTDMFAYIGKASYHIFLVQALFFNLFSFFDILGRLNPDANIVYYAVIVIINIICCTALGILFMKCCDELGRRIKIAITKIKMNDLRIANAFQRL